MHISLKYALRDGRIIRYNFASRFDIIREEEGDSKI